MKKINQSFLKELDSIGVFYNDNDIYVPKRILQIKGLQLADATLFGLLLSCSIKGSPYRKSDELGVYVQLSILELSEMVDVSPRTISRSLVRLEESNLIERVMLFGQTSKTYTL